MWWSSWRFYPIIVPSLRSSNYEIAPPLSNDIPAYHHHIINAANTLICLSLVKQLVGLKTFEGFLHPAGNFLLMMTMLMLLLMTMPKPSAPTRTFDFFRIYVWNYNWKCTYHKSCEDNDDGETLESNCEIQWCVTNSHSFHWILSHVGSGVLVMLTTE